ncbi:MAG: 3-dehydroquinate synthase [Lachnospiraceae bacterium]|nr:3-dehydroquinate synthase [Lachnospiraceae bacterium]
MYDRMEVSLNNEKCYEIVLAEAFDGLAKEVSNLFDPAVKVCIITDSNVEKLYAEEVSKELKKAFETVCIHSFPAGEEHKRLETVNEAYHFLVENHFNRSDLIVALGGGVTGDLSGFVAATYMRGIPFIQLPTTLLSMVDSSIGGKTGVDFEDYKNMVGAFYMPKLVYINQSVLRTLPDRQFSSGMAEVLKAGLIKDGPFYEWTINGFPEILSMEPSILKEMLYRSIDIKRRVVEADPYEKGERALLNYGHTLGHAIEKFYDFTYTHGECVALGSVAAAYIAYKRELLSAEEYYELRDMFVPFELPITVSGLDIDEILRLTSSDKKNDAKGLKFVLLTKIGKAKIFRDVTSEEMRAALTELLFDESE